MTLADTVRQKVADWKPGQGRQDLVVADPATGWAVTITADRRDELGCLVWELALRRETEQAGDLTTWAQRITQQVTGLLESLKIHEVDTLRHEAQLRSEKPAHRAGKLAYYELHLKGTTEAVVRRFQAAENGPSRREQVAFALTHDGLAKLVGDLAG